MIRLIIADDDVFIRESLAIMLGMDPDIEIAGTAGNGQEALELLAGGTEAHVVLMDIRMPICDGVEGTKQIKARFPDVRVLVLTTFDDDEFIIEAIRGGASGYLLKNIPPERIVHGIKTVHEGSMLIHPEIAAKLAGMLSPSGAGNASTQGNDNRLRRLTERGLTPAECQIVERIAEGLSNREIAGRLFLSEGTVKNYVTEILSKLALRDRTQIAIFYLRGS